MKTVSPDQFQAKKPPANSYVLYLMFRFGVTRSEIHEIVRTTGISERRIAEFLHKRDLSLSGLQDHTHWQSLELRRVYGQVAKSQLQPAYMD